MILGFGLLQEGNEREENVREWLRQSDADHQDKLLACGAIIVAQLRMKVLYETKFTCSAGIAHNKVANKSTRGESCCFLIFLYLFLRM